MRMKDMELFRLEDRVLFEAAAVAEIVDAAEAAQENPNANVNETEKQAQEDRDALKNAPPENSAAQAGQNDGKPQGDPSETADVDAQVEQLIQGEIPAMDGDAEVTIPEIGDSSSAVGEADENGNLVDAIIVSSDATISSGKELVVINGTVPDKDAILAELKPNQEVLILENGNGLDELNEYLDAHEGKYDAIHLVTHGNDGYISVNGEIIDAENFDAAEWAAVGEHLTAEGDILFYGCDTAATEEGRLLVDRIAEASGADVAASIDTTGFSGNWELEYNSGSVETAEISVSEFRYELSSYVVTSNANSGEGTLRYAIETEKASEITFNMTDANTSDAYDADTIVLSQVITIGDRDTAQLQLNIDGINQSTGNHITVRVATPGQVQNSAGDWVANSATGSWNLLFRTGNGNCSYDLTLENMTLQGGIQEVLRITGKLDNVELRNLTVEGCNLTEHSMGGAVWITASGKYDSTVLIDNCIFRGNLNQYSSAYGAGLLIMNSGSGVLNAVVRNSQFLQNESASGGGLAIYANQSGWGTAPEAIIDVTVSDCLFDRNQARGAGGAVYINALSSTQITAQFIRSTFTDNSSATNGGAVSFDLRGYAGNSNLKITNCEFTENQAETSGGAIDIKGPSATWLDMDFIVSGSTTFSDNQAGTDGGAICFNAQYVRDTRTYSISGSEFSNNSAEQSGGAVYICQSGGEFSLESNRFEGNTAQSNGGAIFSACKTLNILGSETEKSEFKSNSAQYGGAIYAVSEGSGRTVNISNSTFSQNTAQLDGGAIYSAQVSFLTACTFTENKAAQGSKKEGNGGAVYFASNATVEQSSFSGNTAKYGGAIYSSGNSLLSVFGAEFLANTAAWNGGAVYAEGVINFSDGIFSNNLAEGIKTLPDRSGMGGALYLSAPETGNRTYTLKNCTFSENTAYTYGGAIFADFKDEFVATINLEGGQFSHNTAQSNLGGACYFNGAALTALVSSVTVEANQAKGSGGAIAFSGKELTVKGGSFTDNKTANRYNGGGAIYFSGQSLDISSQASFNGNISGGYGGAVSAFLTAAGSVNINGEINFTDNFAGKNGGALYLAAEQKRIVSNWTITIEDAVFTNNKIDPASDGEGGGGAIYLTMDQNAGTMDVSISDCSFEKNSGACGGAINSYIAGTASIDNTPATFNLKIENSTFISNEATSVRSGNGGGAVRVRMLGDNIANLQIIGSKFENNIAQGNGGAIQFYGPYGTSYLCQNLTISDSEFLSNTAVSGNGGAVEVQLPGGDLEKVIFSNLTFTGNRAGGNGGAVAFSENPSSYKLSPKIDLLEATECSFTENHADGDGGAWYLTGRNSGTEKLVFTQTSWVKNSAGNQGGAVMLAAGWRYKDILSGNLQATWEGGLFEANSAGSDGGALFANQWQVKGNSVSFTGNLSEGNGGAVALQDEITEKYLVFHKSEFSLCNFENNSSLLDGGAIHAAFSVSVALSSCSLTISEGNLQLNNTTGNGGAVAFNGTGNAEVTIATSTLNSNTAQQNGGAVSFTGVGNAAMTISNSTLNSNTAQQNGGAVTYSGCENAAMTISNSTLNSNTAQQNGGAVTYSGYENARFTALNSLFAQNRAEINGGGLQLNGSAALRNLTIVENKSATGGGLDATGTAVMVSNTIFWGNRAALDQQVSGSADFSWCAIEGWTGGGDHNISLQTENSGTDRRGVYHVNFIDPSNGDYRLASTSYLINRGDATSIPASEKDLAGQQRVQFGHVDIGAYESGFKGNIILDFSAPESLLYGESAELKAGHDGRDGGDISFSSGSPAISVEGSTATAVKAPETVELTASLAESDFWNAASATALVRTLQRHITVTADHQNKTYGDADPELSYTVEGLINGDTMSGSLGREAGEDVGSYAITQGTLDAGSNYLIDFRGAELVITPKTITVTADHQSKIYGDADPKLSYTVVGLVNGDTLTGALEREAGEDVGSYAITQGTLDAGSNYLIDFRGAELVVTQRLLTITADSADKMYDGSALTDSGYSYVGSLANGDTIFGVDVTGSITDFGVSDNVVGDVVIMRGDVDVTGNYLINKENGILSITKRDVVIIANSDSKVYDGTVLTNDGYILTGSGFVDGEGCKDIRVEGEQLLAGSSANRIEYELADGTLAGNYEITVVDGTLTVECAALTINNSDQTVVYGDSPETQWSFTDHCGNTVTVVATIDGDRSSGGYWTVAGEHCITVVNVTVTDRDGRNVSSCYEIDASRIADLTVTPAELAVHRDGADKTYDATVNGEYEFRLEGVLTGDRIDYAKGEALFDNAHVGTDKSLTISGDRISGVDLANYRIKYVDTGADIRKAVLIFETDEQTKYAGEEDPELTWTITGGKLFGTDTIDGITRQPGEAPGDYAIDGFRLNDGNGGNNYEITFKANSLHIVVRPYSESGRNVFIDSSTFEYDVNGESPLQRIIAEMRDEKRNTGSFLRTGYPKLEPIPFLEVTRGMSGAVMGIPAEELIGIRLESDRAGEQELFLSQTGMPSPEDSEWRLLDQPVKLLRSFFIDDVSAEDLLEPAYDLRGVQVELPRRADAFKSELELLLEELVGA